MNIGWFFDSFAFLNPIFTWTNVLVVIFLDINIVPMYFVIEEVASDKAVSSFIFSFPVFLILQILPLIFFEGGGELSPTRLFPVE